MLRKEELENEVYQALKKLKRADSIGISGFLKGLNLSSLHPEHRYVKYPGEAMIKLLLLRDAKKLKSTQKALDYLKKHEKEAFDLGFFKDEKNLLELPNQRTVSYFYNHILNKENRISISNITQILNETGNKFDFFPEIPDEPKKQTNNSKTIYNRKNEKTKQICKFLKKNAYDLISLKMHHNTKYQKNTLLDILVHSGINRTFMNGGVDQFREQTGREAPIGRTIRHHFSKFDLDKVQRDFMIIFENYWKLLKSKNILKRRTYDVAIDFTDIPYYGKPSPDIVGKKPEKGTSWGYRFITISIVEKDNRITLLALPVRFFEMQISSKLVEILIKYAKGKVKIRNVYVDRGFFSVEMINKFKELNVKFLMPATKNRRVVKMLNVSPGSLIVKDYEMSNGKKLANFNLVIVEASEGIKRAFATNIILNQNESGFSEKLFHLYSKRWSIETGYRVEKGFMAKTTSKNYAIRVFYFLFAVLTYNLWLLADIFVCLSVFSSVPFGKHVITAKLFGVIFEKVSVF
ncbi:MAG: transposase [Candidatus Aenigmarchaeota archaeon]|nr:transposase [Candidatus Aenigmarchaeota archaeon]